MHQSGVRRFWVHGRRLRPRTVEDWEQLSGGEQCQNRARGFSHVISGDVLIAELYISIYLV